MVVFLKNGTFRIFLKSKFDPNIHPKRTKLHHFKKNFREGRGMPPNPPSDSDMQIFKSPKKLLAPLPNPGYAPVYIQRDR